jgi:hypothetical protein
MSDIKLAVCGDSYMTIDQSGIHWTDQLDPTVHKNILAIGACSNVLIANQVRYAIALGYNNVVVGFTRNSRLEFDKDSSYKVSINENLTVADHKRWRHSIMHDVHTLEKQFVEDYYGFVSTDFLALQSYHVILSTLHFLKVNKVKFAYSLGGVDFPDQLFTRMSIPNEIDDYKSNEIEINLWDYPGTHALTGFHVYDKNYQDRFAQSVMQVLESQSH